MSSIWSAGKLGSQTGGRPPAAVEVSPEGVLAAVRRGGALGSGLHGSGHRSGYSSGNGSGARLDCGFSALPAGAVVPGIETPNLRAPEKVANAIRDALGQVSPHSRAVTLVLPDTVVRVFVLDFDSLPPKAADALPVLRFRLRKMVPFDVEHAGVSYQVLSESKDECRVLAAILPGAVLAEYEGAVRAAGFEPGAVLPSSLAALEAVDSLEAILAANLSAQSLTTTIAAGEDLLLYRTLDLPNDADERIVEIQRGIAVAAAYFEDKLHVRPTRLYYAGNRTASEVAGWIDDPELAVVDLVARSEQGSGEGSEGGPENGTEIASGAGSLAGVAGALAGVS